MFLILRRRCDKALDDDCGLIPWVKIVCVEAEGVSQSSRLFGPLFLLCSLAALSDSKHKTASDRGRKPTPVTHRESVFVAAALPIDADVWSNASHQLSTHATSLTRLSQRPASLLVRSMPRPPQTPVITSSMCRRTPAALGQDRKGRRETTKAMKMAASHGSS